MILGRKIGMTTIYQEELAMHVTLVYVGENKISGLRVEEKDGYSALEVEFRDDKQKSFKREFRLEVGGKDDFQVGQDLSLEQFSVGDLVVVKGVSKGKGFQGVVKRHGFAGAPASHGHRHDLRAPGSIGSAFPERVMKGKKMAGRMGSQSVTVKNLQVVQLDKENKIMAVRGALPGNNGDLVKIISQD